MQVPFLHKLPGNISRALKIVIATILAIAVAGEFGLKYSATAGIITVLSIQNTKRETIKSARNRGLAFICALLIAAASYQLLGFTLWAFGVYLFLFILVCFLANWTEAIAMDSVLISHFLVEQTFTRELIVNELGLFIIGVGFGIAINLHLHPKEKEFDRLANQVDEQFKSILHCMSLTLSPQDCSNNCTNCIHKLQVAIQEAKQCAVVNFNNQFWNASHAELDYIQMRESQSNVLLEIQKSMNSLQNYPKQAEQVAALFAKIERDFHKDNTVEQLLIDLHQVLADMKQQELPVTRDEFESRAILFYVIMQMKNLLQIKREYVMKKEKPQHVYE